MKPRTASSPEANRLGDFALLIAIMLVGGLPFVGWALHYEVARWELGLGTAVVLFAGAETIRELLLRRRRRDARSRPEEGP